MLRLIGEFYERWRIGRHIGKTLSKIEEHGWTATYVYEPLDGSHIDFAYTVGFSDHGAPELIAFDLPPEIANYVFWLSFEQIVSGKTLKKGDKHTTTEPEMHGFECMFLEATHPDTWDKYIFDAISYSLSRGRTDKPAAMQIVWPSSAGLIYPWQPDCPKNVIDAQPPLYARPQN